MGAWLQENLVCPQDQQSLQWISDVLVCPSGHQYAVIDGIPVMLIREADATCLGYRSTLEKVYAAALNNPSAAQPATPNETGGIDDFVQRQIDGTCGRLYSPLINNLPRYPVPEIRLPPGDGARFLEVGCNWGRWCVSAAQKGYMAVGIDPTLDAVLAARRVARQLGVDALFLVADGRQLPFKPGLFDVAFSYSVLQHLDKEDARRCVADGQSGK